jgi:single-stranded DNA-binding protein
MAEERLQSDGAIYTNKYKKAGNQPDWTGRVMLSKEILKELVTKLKSENNADGVEMRVALWDRTSKNGNEYKYARLDVPQEQQKPAPAPEPEPEPDDFDDDIPF